MSQISLQDLSIRYRGPVLLDGVSARIDLGERIGLLGRNGAGKTTLLKILSGDVVPDSGTIELAPQTRVARLTQDVPKELTGSVHDVVLTPCLGKFEPEEAWRAERVVQTTLSQMEINGDLAFETLSSGMKRRVLLAQAIASEPDVLLLDEPTNHLDINSILWLESFLRRFAKTLVFITHDRTFLQALATRIWEIDRGRLFDWACNYPTFLQRKAAALDAEEKQNALKDKKLAQEEVWIRQGIKARRTRNEGRVRALLEMRREHAARQSPEGKARLNLIEAERSGALVADVKEAAFSYPGVETPVFENFSTTIMRGDKLGIVGKNGAGKTTLLKVLLGELAPSRGKVRLGTNLQVAYFDQLRDTLDPEQTVAENVGEGNDRLSIAGQTKHIVGYLQEFLFNPDRARTLVKFLSGGEKNRALLAKMMTRPANVIVLDEPTNDLDSETLELLEEQLLQFQGTLLMVSHDRTFLNNVVSSLIVFEEYGLREYDGGYDDWQRAVARSQESKTVANGNAKPVVNMQTRVATPEPTKARKLSFKEQFELDGLPDRIERLDQQIAETHQILAAPDFYKRPSTEIATLTKQLTQLEEELRQAYERLELLESLA